MLFSHQICFPRKSNRSNLGVAANVTIDSSGVENTTEMNQQHFDCENLMEPEMTGSYKVYWKYAILLCFQDLLCVPG